MYTSGLVIRPHDANVLILWAFVIYKGHDQECVISGNLRKFYGAQESETQLKCELMRQQQ